MAGTVRPRLKSDFPWNLNKLYFILSLDIEDSHFFVFALKTIQVKTKLKEMLVMMTDTDKD